MHLRGRMGRHSLSHSPSLEFRDPISISSDEFTKLANRHGFDCSVLSTPCGPGLLGVLH